MSVNPLTFCMPSATNHVIAKPHLLSAVVFKLKQLQVDGLVTITSWDVDYLIENPVAHRTAVDVGAPSDSVFM